MVFLLSRTVCKCCSSCTQLQCVVAYKQAFHCGFPRLRTETIDDKGMEFDLTSKSYSLGSPCLFLGRNFSIKSVRIYATLFLVVYRRSILQRN